MAGPAETVDQYVIRTIKERLAAVDASRPDWDEASQTRFVRLLAEQGIDKLEAAEEEYFEYVTHCILLAGENMQDARLQILEDKVEKLENPPIDLAETLFNASLMLVAELIIAHGAWVALPALYGLARGRTWRRMINATRKIEGAVLDYEVKAAHEAIEAATKQHKEHLRRIRQFNQIGNHAAAMGERVRLRENAQTIVGRRNWLQFADGMRRDNTAAFNRVKAALEGERQIGDARMKKLLEGVTAGVAVGRYGEALGEDFATAMTDDAAPTVAELAGGTERQAVAYETSTFIADYLAAVQADRRISRDTWSSLRLHVRFVPDAWFYESAIVQDVLSRAAEADYWSVSPGDFGGQEQAMFILGFEMMLWLHWFAFNSLLSRETFADQPLIVVPLALAAGNGKATGGRLVTKTELRITSLPDGTEHTSTYISGISYPGAPRLSEEQVKFFYQKFVRRYFMSNPKAAPAPLTFDAAHYDQTWAMAEGWILDNPHRTARIEELRILTIEYFRQELDRIRREKSTSGGGGAAGRRIRTKMRAMLGLDPTDQPLNNLLKQLPEGTDAPGSLLLSQPTRDGVDHLAATLADVDGRNETWLIGDARSLLETAIADLDLQITAFDTGVSTEDDPIAVIDAFKARLRHRQAEFLSVAKADASLTTKVQIEHGDRITALLDWTPPEAAVASKWRWYGPDDEPTPA